MTVKDFINVLVDRTNYLQVFYNKNNAVLYSEAVLIRDKNILNGEIKGLQYNTGLSDATKEKTYTIYLD